MVIGVKGATRRYLDITPNRQLSLVARHLHPWLDMRLTADNQTSTLPDLYDPVLVNTASIANLYGAAITDIVDRHPVTQEDMTPKMDRCAPYPGAW